MKKDNTKFEFDTSFQLEILRYLLKDKEGGLIIKKIKPSYLVLIEHSLIAEGIFTPGGPSLIPETERSPTL